MKKIVLTQFRHLEIVEAPIPVPGPGEAVIRIRYAGICGSDLHVYDGLNANAAPPLIMGHEGAGELVQTSKWGTRSVPIPSSPASLARHV